MNKLSYLIVTVIIVVGMVAGISACLRFPWGESTTPMIVVFEDGVQDILAEFSRLGIVARTDDLLELINGIACNLTDSQIWILEALDIVKYVEPDGEVHTLEVPIPRSLRTDLLVDPTGLAAIMMSSTDEIPWGIKKIRAPEAWEITTGLDGVTLEPVKVAVIDTGIDTDHPDLVGAVAGGYNAITGGSYEDDNNHGTSVATVIAARRNNLGIVGVVPDAELYAVKVLKANGSGMISDVIKGLYWVSQQDDIHLVNMSLGSYYHSRAQEDAVLACAGYGIGVVAAGGNDGEKTWGQKLIYPARYRLCVSVGAISTGQANFIRASFSNRGEALRANGVVAPGVYVKCGTRNGGYRFASGTSLAAPHVAGIVAMLVAQKWCTRKFLFQGSDQYATPNVSYGYGRIDAMEVLGAQRAASAHIAIEDRPGFVWE